MPSPRNASPSSGAPNGRHAVITIPFARRGQQASARSSEHQGWIPLNQVAADLETHVLGLGLVEESLSEYNAARRIVRAFLAGAGASESSEVDWGSERAHLALQGIDALIQQKHNMRRLQPQYAFNLVSLPVEPRPMPTDVLDRYDEFERGRWYSGWRRSILPIVSFDAKTTERRLAEILDSSSHIEWWLRLRLDDPAYIEPDTGGRYFPDFIAVDNMGVQWLIEGKSDHDVQRRDVEAKRAAAEEWARFVNDDGRFGTWRYLFCSETALKNSHSGWDSLLVAAGAA